MYHYLVYEWVNYCMPCIIDVIDPRMQNTMCSFEDGVKEIFKRFHYAGDNISNL